MILFRNVNDQWTGEVRAFSTRAAGTDPVRRTPPDDPAVTIPTGDGGAHQR
jgi:hypothetical protein